MDKNSLGYIVTKKDFRFSLFIMAPWPKTFSKLIYNEDIFIQILLCVFGVTGRYSRYRQLWI